jgi:hypothetical protein
MGGLTIPDLGWAAASLLERAGRPLLDGCESPVRMIVRQVRRRSGKGLAVVYDARPELPRRARRESSRYRPMAIKAMKAWAWGATGLVSLKVGERSLAGMRAVFGLGEVRSATVEVEASGRVSVPDLDLAVDVFPVDLEMPALATCCRPEPGGPLWRGLETAARARLDEDGWRLRGVEVEPVRYKLGDRCVLLFHLELDRPGRAAAATAPLPLTVAGKLHAEPEQARFNHAVQQALFRTSEPSRPAAAGPPPLVPRPLAFVEELGLTLSEAVATADAGAGDDEGELGRRDGGRAGEAGSNPWRPRVRRGAGGQVVAVTVPAAELEAAAGALARLHARHVAAFAVPARPPEVEVSDVRRRAARIAEGNPGQAPIVHDLAERVAERLLAEARDARRPVHGSFKPSQLLFEAGAARVIDWDEMVAGDPALDVGSFLAWLRPGGVWYGRAGSRRWFDAAAQAFVRAYVGSATALGLGWVEVLETLERARAYEASKLFKVAVRRVRWLNAPRPGELAAMCAEIADCLRDASRWREVCGRCRSPLSG